MKILYVFMALVLVLPTIYVGLRHYLVFDCGKSGVRQILKAIDKEEYSDPKLQEQAII